jgi:small subunit ribosomal protein S1
VAHARQELPAGAIVEGKVTKLVPFGAFVELGDGIEGLVHISEMAPRTSTPRAQVVQRRRHRQGQGHGDRPRASSHLLSMKAAAADLGYEIEVADPPEGEERPARKPRKQNDEKVAE